MSLYNRLIMLVLALLLAPPAPALHAAEFTRSTPIEVAGRDLQLGVTFRAARGLSATNAADQARGDEVYHVDVSLGNGKRLSARLNYSSQSLTIKFRSIASGRLTAIGRPDIETFDRLERSLPRLTGRAGDALTSLISWVSQAPSNTLIDVNAAPRSARAISSLCAAVGTYRNATYDLDSGVTRTQSRRISQCYQAATSCFGRCGAGCDSNPSNPTKVQRYTQDCFNHDFCRSALGTNFGQCTDEWNSAADDFFFGKDCGDMRGTWTDSFLNSWLLTSNATRGTVTTGSCGTYSVSGSRPGGSSFTLRGTASAPPAGCCASFSYNGTLDTCSRDASVRWTNSCGQSGYTAISR